MKKSIVTILIFILIIQTISHAQDPARIKTIIEPAGTANFSYSIIPLSTPLRINNPELGMQIPIYNIPTWGILNEFENQINLINTPLGDLAMSAAYQKHRGDTITLFYTGNGVFPFSYIIAHESPDGSLDTILNMIEVINPDFHGVHIENGVIYYSEQVFDSLFINGEMRWTMGGNIHSYDLISGEVDTVFSWFDNVPETMYIDDYWTEMWNGSQFDWPHFNWISMDWDGNLLVSWRHMGFSKIDPNNGDVIWWGGLPDGLASSHGFNELTCSAGDCRTRLNHHINPFPGKNGWYTLFDNGDHLRPDSRAIEFSIEGLDIFIQKEYVTEPSPFMGSVHIWDSDTNYLLVNTPTLGSENWFDSVQVWNEEGTVTENLETRLAQSGSVIRLINRDNNNIVGQWRTDSLNFIYSAEIRDLENLVSALNEVEQQMFVIFPNPAEEFIYLPEGSCRIYNMHGQLILESSGNAVQVGRLTSGQYLVVSDDGFVSTFVKL